MSTKHFILCLGALLVSLMLLAVLWVKAFVIIQQKQLVKSRYDTTLDCQRIASTATNPSWQYNNCLEELGGGAKEAGESAKML